MLGLVFQRRKNLNSQGAGCIFLFWKELRCYQVFIFVPGSSALHIGTDTCVPGPGSYLYVIHRFPFEFCAGRAGCVGMRFNASWYLNILAHGEQEGV